LSGAWKGRPIFIIGNPPYYSYEGRDDKQCLSRPSYLPTGCRSLFFGYPVTYSPYDSESHDINEMLKSFADLHENIYYIDIYPIVCPNNVCTTERNALIYSDGHHLSSYGSKQVGVYVMQQIESILSH